MSSTDPSVLTDGQLLQFCASVLEQHAESIFVFAKDGRRLIAELRSRADGTAPPTQQDVARGVQAVATSGEVLVDVHEAAPREELPSDEKWLPNPIPGRTNIRLLVVDQDGVVASVEFGNASVVLAEAAVTMLTDEHAKGLKDRQGKTS